MTLLQKINLRKKLSEKKLFFLIGVLFLSALAGAKAAIALPDKNMSEITTHTDTDNREYVYIPEDTELILKPLSKAILKIVLCTRTTTAARFIYL